MINIDSQKAKVYVAVRMMMVLFVAILLFRSSVSSAEAISGTCGSCLNWNLSDLGILTITGTGAMDDYTPTSTPPWEARKGSITKIIIGDGVTTIGDYAFDNCRNASEIEFGEGLVSIGKYSFHIYNPPFCERHRWGYETR